MFQNYQLDIGFIYYFIKFNYEQSLIIDTTSSQDPMVVLTTYLPTIYSQLIPVSKAIFCELPKGIKHRRVEIELVSNNAKYIFDIPFNSSSSILYDSLITELDNIAIKSWTITGEKISQYKLPILLTKVP